MLPLLSGAETADDVDPHVGELLRRVFDVALSTSADLVDLAESQPYADHIVKSAYVLPLIIALLQCVVTAKDVV